MELIVAVYDDWGIGRDGTQPIALSADRKFFRQATKGCMVIAGRRTIEDFPGQKPLPGRVNVVLTRSERAFPGFTICASPEEVLKLAKGAGRAMVIGGGSVYRQLLPYCDTAYVTKIQKAFPADRYFPDLDADPAWTIAKTEGPYEHEGLTYFYVTYRRK